MSNSATIVKSIAAELSKVPSVSFFNDVQLSDGLLDGSVGNAAVIACSDMGWSVPYVCTSADAQLYLFQNLGHTFKGDGFAEMVVRSRIEHVVVYGHSVCDYMKFFAKTAVEQGRKGAREWLESDERLHLYSAALESGSELLWEKVGQYNVLYQLKEMLADPVLGPLAEQGKLKMHGWFFNSTPNQLEVFDPKAQAFVAQRTKLPDSLAVKFLPGEIQVQDDNNV